MTSNTERIGIFNSNPDVDFDVIGASKFSGGDMTLSN